MEWSIIETFHLWRPRHNPVGGGLESGGWCRLPRLGLPVAHTLTFRGAVPNPHAAPENAPLCGLGLASYRDMIDTMKINPTILLWARRILITLFLLGSGVVIWFWWLYVTAKCEGFGCIGLGWLIFLLVTAGSVCSLIGGVLMWIDFRVRKTAIPKWMWALELLNASPLFLLLMRMLFVNLFVH